MELEHEVAFEQRRRARERGIGERPDEPRYRPQAFAAAAEVGRGERLGFIECGCGGSSPVRSIRVVPQEAVAQHDGDVDATSSRAG
ncbi:MAG: hypothetical protein U1F67_16435 [Rubrivivax sp.]